MMRRHLVLTTSCGVIVTGSSIAAAVVLAHLLAGLITDPDARAPSHWSSPLWILVALWTIRVLAQWAQARVGQRGATAAIADLNRQLLEGVTALPPRELAARHGEAAALSTRGLDALRPYYTRYLPAVVQAAVLTPAAVVAIACYDIQAAVVVVVALPLVPLFMVLIGLVTAERSAAALTAAATLQSRLLDLVTGIPTLRALGRADGAEDRIVDLAEAHRRSTMATLRITFLSSLVLELLATLGVALVAVSVGLRLVYGEIELSSALTVILLAPEVFWPLRRVGAEFHAAQDGRTSKEKATALLQGAEPTPRGHLVPPSTSVSLRDVSVSTRDGDAPQRLWADVEPGTVTVLTGPNGSGKSTALHTVLGLTAPTSGHVLVDGVDVADLDPRQWWSRIAWLPQRPALVPGTIAANLELLGPLVDVEDACRRAGFDDVVASLPHGLATVIGRDGVGLSLGQRQRLALARAFGARRPVLLLDEPTAHLDGDRERFVLESIRQIAREGAAVLVVGHRDAVRDIADRVVVVGAETHVAA